MDPVTLLATATAIFNGVQKAVKMGQEVEGVFQQLSKWAGAVDELQQWIGKEERKPSIFKAISFGGSATSEAFDTIIAKQKLKQMEDEIRHMFTWGELGHLGETGYREFIQLRRDIKRKREQVIADQIKRRRAFVRGVFEWSAVIALVALTSWMLWWAVVFIIENGRFNSKDGGSQALNQPAAIFRRVVNAQAGADVNYLG